VLDVRRFVMAISMCLWILTGTALGEPVSAGEEPTASGEQGAAEEDEGFIDIDIDTNMDDDVPLLDVDIDLTRLPFPSRDPSRKGQGTQAEDRRWNEFLPLFRKQAQERGYRLPLPMGIGATFMRMDQSLQVTDLRVGLEGSDPSSVEILREGDVDATSKNVNMRFDAWLLPILNVYAVVGYTWADSDVVLRAEITPPGGVPEIVDIPVKASVEGPTYGLGSTLVAGYSIAFGMFDVNYTWTDISEFDQKIEKLVATARAGVQGSVWRMTGALWVGTMYLNNKQTIEITLPDNIRSPALRGARIEIDQNSDHRFNFLIGGAWEVTPHIQLAVEGGIGERSQIMIGPAYRF